MTERFAHRRAIHGRTEPYHGSPMWQDFAWLIVVVAVNFTDSILARSVRTKHEIALLNAFRYCPQSAAGEACANLCLVGMASEVNWNELFVKPAPFLRQLLCQVLMDTE